MITTIYNIAYLVSTMILMMSYEFTHPPSDSECDVDSNIKYSLKSYIIFSLSMLFLTTLLKLIMYNHFNSNITANCVSNIFTYITFIVIIIGGIFIAQQMNVHSECYNFLMNNKNSLCIFISVQVMILINIIYHCVEFKSSYTRNEYFEL